jgi:hypothetical protein
VGGADLATPPRRAASYLELDSVNMCVSKYPISYLVTYGSPRKPQPPRSCRYCASPFSIAVVCRSQRPKSRPAPGPPTPAGYTADSTLCRAARPSQAFPAPRRHRALISPGVGRRAAWRRLAAAHILAPKGLGRPADLSRSRHQATRGIGGQRARHIPWSLGPRSAASRSGWWRTRRNPCDRRLPSPHSGTTAPS